MGNLLDDKVSNGFNLTVANVACVQFKIDDEVNIFQQQASVDTPASSYENSLEHYEKLDDSLPQAGPSKSPQTLNYCFIESFVENKEIVSNFNLILFIKEVNLNSYIKMEPTEPDGLTRYFCLTINGILCTWSLQIHYILYEALIKPSKEFQPKLFRKFNELCNKEPNLNKFKLNVLVESDILFNLLFDFAQDSSKPEAAKNNGSKRTWFNYNQCLHNSNIRPPDLTLPIKVTKIFTIFKFGVKNNVLKINRILLCIFFKLLSLHQ